MRNPMDEIREDIRRLHLAHARGDLREKAFQRLVAQRTMDLYRALVENSLQPGERIIKEHHVVEAHMKLTRSVLQEPEQVATSLFLTQKRLLRVRSWIRPGEPTTADQRDGTILDEIPLAKIQKVESQHRIRPGEALAGFAMGAVGFVFGEWLEVTGVLLMVLGLLGVLHGLLLPTRWLEITGKGAAKEPIRILAPGKKSAKELVTEIRSHLNSKRRSFMVPVGA